MNKDDLIRTSIICELIKFDQIYKVKSINLYKKFISLISYQIFNLSLCRILAVE